LSNISGLNAWICGRLEVYKTNNDPSVYREKARYMENYSNLDLKELVELYKFCLEHLAPIRPPTMHIEENIEEEKKAQIGTVAPRPRIQGIPLPPDGEYQGEYTLNRFE